MEETAVPVVQEYCQGMETCVLPLPVLGLSLDIPSTVGITILAVVR